MILYDEIRKELKQKISSGKTQDEISRQAGISQSHLCHLKNGSRSIGGMTLDTFLKLFPNAQIILNAESVTTGNNAPIVKGRQSVGINNGTIHNCEQNYNELKRRIQDAVMKSEKLDPSAKMEVYNLISDLD